MMRFGLTADPAQHEVDRRDKLNLHRIGIERVFARRERRAPDTAMTDFNLFAVSERFASGVVSRGAMIGNHHADIPNWDQRLRSDFHCAEPAIDKERAVGQDLQLLTALTSEC